MAVAISAVPTNGTITQSSGNTDHTDNTDNSGYFIGANPGRTLTLFHFMTMVRPGFAPKQ